MLHNCRWCKSSAFIVVLCLWFVLGYCPKTRAENIIRPQFSAGTFYPEDPKALYDFIFKALNEEPALTIPKANTILVPHAGLSFSGKIAADSFREVPKNFKRVFIIAANHNGKAPFQGVSIPKVTHYQIPGTLIPLSNVVLELFKNPLFKSIPEAHTMHMIEVELPFLYALKGHPAEPQFTIIPMIVGTLNEEEIKNFASLLSQYADDETLFVFSADLSHYFSHEQARQLDAFTIEALKARDSKMLAKATTDGNQILMTLAHFAQMNHLWPTFISSTNSGIVTNTKDRVVGYASMIFHPKPVFSSAQQQALLDLTKLAVKHAITNNTPLPIADNIFKSLPWLNSKRAVFVTLNKNGILRGCMGYTFPIATLGESLVQSALNASLRDPRFTPVTPDEFNSLEISLSILDYPQRLLANSPVEITNALKPNIDGVIIQYGKQQSLFLPQVWTTFPQPEIFLTQLCLKQNAPAQCWQYPEARIYRFETVSLGEK